MIILSIMIDLTLAFVFLLAFVAKIEGWTDLKLHIRSYRIVPDRFLSLAAFSLLNIELIFSFWFISGGYPVVKELSMMIVLVVFSLFLIYKERLGGNAHCACFGRIEVLNRNPYLRNGTFLIMLVISIFLPARSFSVMESIICFAALSFMVWITHVISQRKIVRSKGQVVQLFNKLQSDTTEEDVKVSSMEHALFLHYKSPEFEKIDDLLSSKSYPSLLVFFQAPPWLVLAKNKVWDVGILEHSDGKAPVALTEHPHILTWKQDGSPQHVLETISYMEWITSKGEKAHD